MEIHTYRSVWDAIADGPEEATNLKLRSQLMDAIEAYIAREAITQEEAARRLGVPRSAGERTRQRPDQQIHYRQAGEHGCASWTDYTDQNRSEAPPLAESSIQSDRQLGDARQRIPPRG